MKYDCLVIGAGLSGCTAARLLAETGKKVLVIEKGRNIAGNCHDYLSDAGITVHTHGPHIFHTVYKEVWDFLSRFTQFRLFQHRVLSYVHGMTVPFPINKAPELTPLEATGLERIIIPLRAHEYAVFIFERLD